MAKAGTLIDSLGDRREAVASCRACTRPRHILQALEKPVRADGLRRRRSSGSRYGGASRELEAAAEVVFEAEQRLLTVAVERKPG